MGLLWAVVQLVLAYLIIKECVTAYQAWKAKRAATKPVTPADLPPGVPITPVAGTAVLAFSPRDAVAQLQTRIHNWVAETGLVTDVKIVDLEVKRIVAFALISIVRHSVDDVLDASQRVSSAQHFEAITALVTSPPAPASASASVSKLVG